MEFDGANRKSKKARYVISFHSTVRMRSEVAGPAGPSSSRICSDASVVYAGLSRLERSYLGGSGAQTRDWSVTDRSAHIPDPERENEKRNNRKSEEAGASLVVLILSQLIVYFSSLHFAGVFSCDKARTN